jgi:hypothetical protein
LKPLPLIRTGNAGYRRDCTPALDKPMTLGFAVRAVILFSVMLAVALPFGHAGALLFLGFLTGIFVQ